MLRSSLIRCLAALVAPAMLSGQGAPSLALQPSNGSLAYDFKRLISVRELGDGRVLVSDRSSNRVLIGNFEIGVVDTIAPNDNPAAQFGLAGPLFALAGDSTLLADFDNRRWHFFRGARHVSTVDARHPAVAAVPVLMGSDTLGHVLGRNFVRAVGADRSGDSASLVLAYRSTSRVDTIAKLIPLTATSQSALVNEVKRTSTLRVTLSERSASEQAVLFPDGWVAIARLRPFRVDWREPDGRVTHGAHLADNEPMLPASGSPGTQASNTTSATDTPPFPGISRRYVEAPNPALFAAPDGRVLILRRVPSSSTTARYYVIDRSGSLRGVLVLDVREEIIGFGARSVYVAVTSNRGTERLRRHPWP